MMASEPGYLSHSKNQFGRVSLLKDHLQDVARRAADYAAAFGASDEARLAGLLHDLGKYGDFFKRRLEGKEHGIDHWSMGAWTALSQYKQNGVAVALAIQGHHLGLQQASKDTLGQLNPAKLQEYHPVGLRLSEPRLETLLKRMETDGLGLPGPSTSVYPGLKESFEQTAASMLDVRMLFSALVDADFLETEAHFQGNPDGTRCYREAGPPLQPELALPKLVSHIEKLAQESRAAAHVNQLRADLLKACLEAGTLPQGLFTLTAPTGTGKTLAMLAFALKHAVEHHLQRVVMVIPYLTIIDQTVREYRKVFSSFVGPDQAKRYVLEHHSLAGTRHSDKGGNQLDQDMEDEGRRRARLLAENWDAPIIVTTSVQFLESVFANRPSACRKLHRLAKSVLLFDEVQTLPVPLAVPTLATLSRLVERYDSTVVFATATQPAFVHLDSSVRQYCFSGWRPHELVPSELKLFQRAKRTCVEWPASMKHTTPWTELAEKLSREGEGQVLCIVNLKSHAFLLYDKLKELNVEGLFHLSTSMCPAHRETTLETVRTRLDRGDPCRLISTQCVEAGVDVDFPVVYRAYGPLDAIAQAAGRCNRNGHAGLKVVHVFVPEEEKYPDRAYGQAAGVVSILLNKRGPDKMDIHDPQLFKEYYEELYDIVRPEKRKQELTDAIRRQDFVDVANLYRVIEKDAINVLAPYDPRVFRALEQEVRETGLNRKWIDKARPYTIGLFRPRPHDPVSTYLIPIPLGRGASTGEEDWFIYTKEEHYDAKKGLIPPSSLECLIG
jgi:CRISPR-associated helicase Cas3/CRISPR-associated endonuclease Cas3-HD